MGLADNLRVLPTQTTRSVLIWLSHRRSLARTAVRSPLTRSVVARFVAGETLQAALPAIAELKREGLRTTVDVLGESVTSADHAAAAVDRYLVTIGALSERGLDANVSVKLTQMGLAIDLATCLANVMRVVEALRAVDGFLRFDMEDHTTTDATLEIWRAAHEAYPKVGVVIQAALRRSSADVDAIIAVHGRVRLCKGAYDEPGTIAYRTRAAVDANYARLMERLLLADAYPAIATHDAGLIARAIAIAEREGIGRDRFEFQMLYGVRRDLQRTLISRGYTVRVYVPYGAEWYPYFMRRLAERPANVAFMLRAILKEEGRRV
ncbi:MAG TPA: proline dehydrogenase family protein, partial [Terriglobales bacterium]|nr:proline dehydrogenase family protein [Terriglobales bacterium]